MAGSEKGLGMLQEVDGSLTPPIKPGHLSIPLSPASQLSMICWRVGTSQPAKKSACSEYPVRSPLASTKGCFDWPGVQY